MVETMQIFQSNTLMAELTIFFFFSMLIDPPNPILPRRLESNSSPVGLPHQVHPEYLQTYAA